MFKIKYIQYISQKRSPIRVLTLYSARNFCALLPPVMQYAKPVVEPPFGTEPVRAKNFNMLSGSLSLTPFLFTFSCRSYFYSAPTKEIK